MHNELIGTGYHFTVVNDNNYNGKFFSDLYIYLLCIGMIKQLKYAIAEVSKISVNFFILEIRTDFLISKIRFKYRYIRYIMDIFKFGLEME